MRRLLYLIPILVLPILVIAQSPYGVLNLDTKLGAFKILRYNLTSPAEGRLEISFDGSLLVSGYKGKPFEPTMKGVRIEFPDPSVLPNYNRSNIEKVVLHGNGSVVLDGTFMAVECFGRKIRMRWNGRGVIYLYPEFDKNQQTGTYWYRNNTKSKQPWPMPNLRLELPGSEYNMPGIGMPKARPKKPIVPQQSPPPGQKKARE